MRWQGSDPTLASWDFLSVAAAALIVNTIPPNTEKWLRKFYDENNGYGEKL